MIKISIPASNAMNGEITPNRMVTAPPLVCASAELVVLRSKTIKRTRSLVGIELRRANGEVEGSHSRPFGCEMAAHFHQRHVFRGPPIMPDGGISPVRFEVLAFFHRPFPLPLRLKRWFAYTPDSLGLPTASSPGQRPATAPVLSSRPPTLSWKPPSTQSPL